MASCLPAVCTMAIRVLNLIACVIVVFIFSSLTSVASESNIDSRTTRTTGATIRDTVVVNRFSGNRLIFSRRNRKWCLHNNYLKRIQRDYGTIHLSRVEIRTEDAD
jgi:hypothetical protein